MDLKTFDSAYHSRENDSLRVIWEETRDGLALVTPEGIMARVNPAFAEILGWSVPELEGRKFSEITIGEDVGPDLKEFGRLLQGEIHDYTMVKTYTTKARGTVTCKLRAVNLVTGVLVMGQILPVDTLSLEHLPDEDAKRVISMLVGRYAVENWKVIVAAILAVAGVMRLDDLLRLLGGLPAQTP